MTDTNADRPRLRGPAAPKHSHPLIYDESTKNAGAETVLFSQSRALLNEQWLDFVRWRGKLTEPESNQLFLRDSVETTGLAFRNYDRVLNEGRRFLPRTDTSLLIQRSQTAATAEIAFDENAIMMLNKVHFQYRLFLAATRNPLSTFYSAIWTLCSSIRPDASKTTEETEAQFAFVWMPIFLLRRYLQRARRVIGAIMSRENGGQQQTLPMADLEALTDFQQILQAEQNYRREMSNGGSAKETKEAQAAAEMTYLTSDLHKRRCARTPFGTVELRAYVASPQTLELAYVERLNDLRDQRVAAFDFERAQAYEFVRAEVETHLRAEFPHYSEIYGLELETYVLSATTLNAKPADPEDELAPRAMYWQYQKSALTWFVLHTLFALDELVGDEETTEDLLFFVANHLHRYIQCGVCYSHWRDQTASQGEKEWQEHERAFERSKKDRGSELERMSKGMSRVSFDVLTDKLDNKTCYAEMMLRTHNAVQGKRVHAERYLTHAALNGLRQDYRRFARTLLAAVASEIGHINPLAKTKPLPEHGFVEQQRRFNNFFSEVHEQERARSDVVSDPKEISLMRMIDDMGERYKRIGRIPSDNEIAAELIAVERERVRELLYE